MQKFHDVTAGSDRLTRRHVILLAHFFGVSREAMVRRLEELGLTKVGTWDWFEYNGGITDEQAQRERLHCVTDDEAFKPLFSNWAQCNDFHQPSSDKTV